MSRSVSDKGLNYLLIDDDAVDRMAVQRAFKKSNVVSPLYTTSSSIEALEMLESSPEFRPASRNVILLDLNIPKMNGIEFLERLRQSPDFGKTPVIVLTTSEAERDRTRAYELNALGYIVKPVQFSSLVELIETLDRYLSYCGFPIVDMTSDRDSKLSTMFAS
ncbi:MAG: response regulator [Leptolyngbyaceae cyanobacterium]